MHDCLFDIHAPVKKMITCQYLHEIATCDNGGAFYILSLNFNDVNGILPLLL